MDQNEPEFRTEVAEYTATAAGLADLAARYRGVIFEVTNTAGMKQAREARRDLVSLRTDLEARRKELKAPLLERTRLIDAEAKRITNEILVLETPIDEQIRAEEARKAAEREARERAERERVENLQRRIGAYGTYPVRAAGRSAAQIEELLIELHAAAPGEDFEEFGPAASQAHEAALGALETMLLRVREQEAEAARLAAEREAMERERREEQARRAEEERIAAEARAAEEERLAELRRAQELELQAQREAEEARLAEERRREAAQRAAEEARMAEERARQQAEFDRQQAELQRQREEQRAREEEQRAREEAIRAQAERIEREKEERARREREQAEQAQARRIASLRAGAQDLLDAAGSVLTAIDEHELELPRPVVTALEGLRRAVRAIDAAGRETERDPEQAAA